MADEDDLDINGEDSGDSGTSKAGMGGILPTILKWVAIVVGAIILIVTVVVITMNIMNKNSPSQTLIPNSGDFVQTREVLDWYTIETIRTKSSDASPASVIVDVVLGYKSQDKVASTEITQRKIEIKDFIRRYFTQKSVNELKPQNEREMQIEIRNSINDDILTSSKIKDVRFMGLETIEQ